MENTIAGALNTFSTMMNAFLDKQSPGNNILHNAPVPYRASGNVIPEPPATERASFSGLPPTNDVTGIGIPPASLSAHSGLPPMNDVTGIGIPPASLSRLVFGITP